MTSDLPLHTPETFGDAARESVGMTVIALADDAPAAKEGPRPAVQRLLSGDGANLIAFTFTAGQALLSRVLKNHPESALMVAMGIYLGKIAVLLVLLLVLQDATFFAPKVFAATIVFLILVPPHVIPTWHWLLAPIVIFFGFMLVFGVVLFTSFVTSVMPHMKFIWPLLGRFWFYVSGIFFSIERFDPLPAVKTVMEVNPAYVYLSMSRDLLIYHTVPSWDTWIYMAGWAFLFTALGFILFWSREDKYGESN